MGWAGGSGPAGRGGGGLYPIQSSSYVPSSQLSGSAVPLSVARFFHGGVPAAWVVGVVDGGAADSVKCEGLWALG